MSSKEPGVTLGRLIAAERNALTALQLGQANIKTQTESADLIGRQEKKIAQLEQEITNLRQLVVRRMGSGPTG